MIDKELAPPPTIVVGDPTSGERYKVESDLVPLLRPIHSVQLHPKNPRQGDVGGISKSMEDFAQDKAIIVQHSTGHIIAGNHTWKAAIMLGWTHIAVVRKDVNNDLALARMLVDNRLSDMGTYDDAVLLDVTMALPDDLLDMSGYDVDTIDELARSVGVAASGGSDPTTLASQYPTLEEKADKYLTNAIRQLTLHFQADDFEKFLARLEVFMTAEQLATNTEAMEALLARWEASPQGVAATQEPTQ